VSDAWLAHIERELGATIRKFDGMRAALRWYFGQRALRLGRAMPLEVGGSPRSQASIDESNATYARIAACLVQRHAVDDVDEILLFQRRVDHLEAWYASERRQQRLADELDMTVIEVSNYAAHTERLLRRRMEHAGLLTEET
jgi:hypothetical protein